MTVATEVESIHISSASDPQDSVRHSSGGRCRWRGRLAIEMCSSVFPCVLWVLLLGVYERGGVSASAPATHPAARHRGVWTSAPRRTPSSMVPDGPIAANGDMGVGIGNAAHGNQSYYFGKMDFWSSNAFDGSRFEWTHVAPAFIEMSFASVLSAQPEHNNVSWSAVQDLYEPVLNTTLAAGTGADVHTSAVFAPETNVMTVRLRSAKATTLSLRLSTQLPSACTGRTSCMADLPMKFQTTTEPGGGGALTLSRDANHWVNNEAVLVECDSELIPTMGQREFDIASDGAITLQSAMADTAAAEECLALLAAEGRPYPASVRHHPVTDTIVSKAPCATSEGRWLLSSTGEIKHSSTGQCAVYSTTDWSMSVFPEDCSTATANETLGTTWKHDASSGHLQATQWKPGHGLVLREVPQDVPHCLLAPVANVNVSLGMAVLLRESASGTSAPNVAVKSGTAGSEPFAAYSSFDIEAEKEYVMSVSIETTRTNDVSIEDSALNTALRQVRTTDVNTIAVENRKWWEDWWETGAVIDLGPRRQTLESFYYGQQYMLGSMSRPCLNQTKASSGRCRDGATVPGLLGPWSMMNPVGWCDRLTLDYNVEANYFGAASSNHLASMLPYFPTMTPLLESGRRRANMSWTSPWTKYQGYNNSSDYVSQGHPAYARWMTDLEHVQIGPSANLVTGERLTTKGHYKGAQMICAMGPWTNMGQWKDNAIRFDGALMAVPYVDYFEHTMDMEFLKSTAYPFLKPQAEFYADYVVLNQNGTYDVPLACAQEGCGPRQMGQLGSFAQFNPTVDLAFAEWTMRTAAAWAQLLGVDAEMQADFLHKASKLSPYPLTVDPTFQNRTVWSEAKVQRWAGDPNPTTMDAYCKEAALPNGELCRDSTPFHANYMYPIVQFAPMHPCGLVNLDSDAETLKLARQTVWGQNKMSKWAPVNGLCLAWPSAAKLVDGHAAPTDEFGTTTLLDEMESALNHTMQPNLWPSMDGGGVEQVGATQAINDLLLQSVNGKLVFFPGWEPGASVSFTNMRTRGAFLVSARRSASGELQDVRIYSEVGGACMLQRQGGPGTRQPTVRVTGKAAAVAVRCTTSECAFDTVAQTSYEVHF